MAKTVVTTITDDIDGSADAETVRFSYRGVNYEIDLAQKNRDKLDKALASWIDKAVRVGSAPRSMALGRGNGRGGQGSGNPNAEADRTARAWAKSTGFKLHGKPPADRGRLHPDVRQAWIDAGRPQA